MPLSLGQRLQESLEAIRAKTSVRPLLAIILGSGLGDFAETLPDCDVLDTADIPHYPRTTVEGHKGQMIFAVCTGVPLVAFQGRLHFFETNSLEDVLYPIHVARGLRTRIMIVTNAAGGIRKEFEPGDLMLITDQLNLTGEVVPFAYSEVKETKFLYDKELLGIAKVVSARYSTPLWTGIYGGVKGPSYETAAEVRMVQRLGGDAVGMSTVLETTLARISGMRVMGISCITNRATGTSEARLDHAEVTEAANKAKKAFATVLRGVIEEIGKSDANHWN
jgi:purine-nucleoside phosphorylase